MWFILIFIFLSSIFFGAITTFPIVLIALVCTTVVFRESWVLAVAFLAGIFLDLLSVRVLGQTSIFFLIFIFMLFLYEKKFEIQTVPFVFFSSFLGAMAYLLIFGYNHVLEQAAVSSLVAIVLFKSVISISKSSLD